MFPRIDINSIIDARRSSRPEEMLAVPVRVKQKTKFGDEMAAFTIDSIETDCSYLGPKIMRACARSLLTPFLYSRNSSRDHTRTVDRRRQHQCPRRYLKRGAGDEHPGREHCLDGGTDDVAYPCARKKYSPSSRVHEGRSLG